MKSLRAWLPTIGGWLLMAVGAVVLLSSLCAITGGVVAAKGHAYFCLRPFVQRMDFTSDSTVDLSRPFILDSPNPSIVIAIPKGTSMFVNPYLVVFVSALVGILLLSSGAMILFGNRIVGYFDWPSSRTRKSSVRNERLSSRAKTRHIDLS